MKVIGSATLYCDVEQEKVGPHETVGIHLTEESEATSRETISIILEYEGFKLKV